MGSSPTGPTNICYLQTSAWPTDEYTSIVRYPLVTNRLSIQPLSLADLGEFVTYRQDPEIARYQNWDISYSSQQALELIESQNGVSLPEQGSWLQLAIHDRQTRVLIGDVALHNTEQDGSYELGYTIAQPYQNQGFAKEAVSRVLEELVSVIGVKRFIATPDSRNETSIRLLASLGFEQIASKSWTEEFKGELVTVLFFERI